MPRAQEATAGAPGCPDTAVVGTRLGRVLQLKEAHVRPMGRATQGVRIIKLEDKDRACSIAKVRES